MKIASPAALDLGGAREVDPHGIGRAGRSLNCWAGGDAGFATKQEEQ